MRKLRLVSTAAILFLALLAIQRSSANDRINISGATEPKVLDQVSAVDFSVKSVESLKAVLKSKEAVQELVKELRPPRPVPAEVDFSEDRKEVIDRSPMKSRLAAISLGYKQPQTHPRLGTKKPGRSLAACFLRCASDNSLTCRLDVIRPCRPNHQNKGERNRTSPAKDVSHSSPFATRLMSEFSSACCSDEVVLARLQQHC
jgi:hypothetical protein